MGCGFSLSNWDALFTTLIGMVLHYYMIEIGFNSDRVTLQNDFLMSEVDPFLCAIIAIPFACFLIN